MTSIRESAATVALLRRGDRPWSHYVELIETAGSAITVLEGRYSEVHDSDQETLFDPAPQAEPASLEEIAEEIRSWQDEGMEFLTVLDEGYPSNLRAVYDRPPFLFTRGSPDDSRDSHSVAVVGTRRPSPVGLAHADEIAGGLAEAGITVVSGLAAGIDTAAHTAALERGGRTVAVIGTGLRRAYPKANAALQDRIAREGAVISQFWPDAPPTRQSFPMRNVVMSGFARATVVIEAAYISGARMQARFALRHGRPVFLLAELLSHDWAQRYADLPATFVVESSTEILEHLDRLYSADFELTA